MKISIAILNYNSADLTVDLLDCLQDQTDRDFATIVIDNHSQDVDLIKSRIADTDIKLIENEDNLGYAGGNNRALHFAFQRGSDWVLILNPDTRVGPDFVGELKANLAGQKGLCGLPVDENGRLAYGGRVRWLTPPSLTNHIHEYHETMGDRYVIGAALAVSQSAFQRLGQMDERYFLYFEDADYSMAAKRKGVPVTYLRGPVVRHAVSVVTKKLGSVNLIRYQYRNALYFNEKNGPWYVRRLIPLWATLIMAKQYMKILAGMDAALSRAIIAAVRDYQNGNMDRIS